jgi:hypothetical protein
LALTFNMPLEAASAGRAFARPGAQDRRGSFCQGAAIVGRNGSYAPIV